MRQAGLGILVGAIAVLAFAALAGLEEESPFVGMLTIEAA